MAAKERIINDLVFLYENCNILNNECVRGIIDKTIKSIKHEFEEHLKLKEKVDSVQDLLDNKPYEFEELEDEVEYYDNLHKRHVLISFASRGEKHAYSCGFHVPEVITRSNFKPNRFYPREVKGNG